MLVVGSKHPLRPKWDLIPSAEFWEFPTFFQGSLNYYYQGGLCWARAGCLISADLLDSLIF